MPGGQIHWEGPAGSGAVKSADAQAGHGGNPGDFPLVCGVLRKLFQQGFKQDDLPLQKDS